jgi:hypothetical protein
MTTIVAQPFNVTKWQLKFNPVAEGLIVVISIKFTVHKLLSLEPELVITSACTLELRGKICSCLSECCHH